MQANDLVAGFDPTGLQTVTGAQLLTMVSAAIPNIDRGMCLVSADVVGTPVVPDARNGTGNEKWQRYLWIRVQATTSSVYVWNTNGALDATLLYWIPTGALLPALGITGDKIANATIDSGKIISVDWGQLTNIPASGFIPGGTAGGVLAGAYPNPTLRDASVTASKLAIESVQNSSLSGSNGGAACVDIAKNIITAGVWTAKQLIRVNDAATGLQGETKLITQLAEPAFGNALKQVQVNATGNGFQYSVHNVIQKVYQQDKTALADGAGTVLTTSNSVPTTAMGAVVAPLALAFTPLSSSSKLLVKVFASISSFGGAGDAMMWVALFSDAVGANAVAADGTLAIINDSRINRVLLEYSVTPGSTAVINFTVRFGRTTASATAYYNSNHNSGLLGGLLASSISVEEYL